MLQSAQHRLARLLARQAGMLSASNSSTGVSISSTSRQGPLQAVSALIAGRQEGAPSSSGMQTAEHCSSITVGLPAHHLSSITTAVAAALRLIAELS